MAEITLPNGFTARPLQKALMRYYDQVGCVQPAAGRGGSART